MTYNLQYEDYITFVVPWWYEDLPVDDEVPSSVRGYRGISFRRVQKKCKKVTKPEKKASCHEPKCKGHKFIYFSPSGEIF